MNKNKYGLTLIELITVIAIIAILSTIGAIGVKMLQSSFVNNCSKAVINSLLNSARGIAATKQAYMGIRFQKQDNIQYAIFIIHDPNIPYPDDGKTIPFIALENHPPFNLGRESTIATDNDEATIIFSSQGKLVRKWVKVFPKTTKRDDIFGKYGLFPQDKYSKLSNNSFIIKTNNITEKFYINPYIGTLIDINKSQ